MIKKIEITIFESCYHQAEKVAANFCGSEFKVTAASVLAAAIHHRFDLEDKFAQSLESHSRATDIATNGPKGWRYEDSAPGGNCIVDQNDRVIADQIEKHSHGHMMAASQDMLFALLTFLNCAESGHDMLCSELLAKSPAIKKAVEKALGK